MEIMFVWSSHDEARTPINAPTPMLLIPMVEGIPVRRFFCSESSHNADGAAKSLDGNKQWSIAVLYKMMMSLVMAWTLDYCTIFYLPWSWSIVVEYIRVFMMKWWAHLARTCSYKALKFSLQRKGWPMSSFIRSITLGSKTNLDVVALRNGAPLWVSWFHSRIQHIRKVTYHRSTSSSPSNFQAHCTNHWTWLSGMSPLISIKSPCTSASIFQLREHKIPPLLLLFQCFILGALL